MIYGSETPGYFPTGRATPNFPVSQSFVGIPFLPTITETIKVYVVIKFMGTGKGIGRARGRGLNGVRW